MEIEGCHIAGSNPVSHNSPMNLDHYNLSIFAESKEKALEKLKEKMEKEDEELVKIKIAPSIDESYFKSSEAKLRFSLHKNDFYNSLNFVFSASKSDKDLGKNIYETLHGSLEDQAVSFQPDERGRITLGSNYSDDEEVQVIVLDE